MNLETEHLDGVNVITPVVRRLDASVAAAFRQGVSEEISRTTGGLIIDFSRVDFIDSSCLGTLIALFKQMNGKGEMALCSLNSNIMNMFKLTRMDRVFILCPDRAAALARLQKG